MASLVNFFLETQNTGEVNDPPPGVTRRCHFLPGVIFHHLHIRIVPVPLSAVKGKNWQVIILPVHLFLVSRDRVSLWRPGHPRTQRSSCLLRHAPPLSSSILFFNSVYVLNFRERSSFSVPWQVSGCPVSRYFSDNPQISRAFSK